jgi:hypothetical protein
MMIALARKMASGTGSHFLLVSIKVALTTRRRTPSDRV